jgi:predicted RNA binding protein YcfA (HicA-like mRNA interferase family)
VSKLPVSSGRDVAAAFVRMGYQFDHQTSSHIILRHPSQRRLTVPDHREVAKGTLRSLIREAGITKERFVELLNQR